MQLASAISAALIATCLAVPTFAAPEAVPGHMTDAELGAAGFEPLIEDDSLDAWNVESWHEGHWTLRDGVIDYDGKAKHKVHEKASLWTKHDFGDVKLYAEWRLPSKPRTKQQPIVLFNGDFLLDDQGRRITRPGLDAGDSGVMFRGTQKCQANIWSQELGSGEINGYRTDRNQTQQVRRACIPIKKADRPLGDWNVFLIELDDDKLTIELNHEKVIDAAFLPDLPAKGPIGLQHHGDPVQFRRIWVKELN